MKEDLISKIISCDKCEKTTSSINMCVVHAIEWTCMTLVKNNYGFDEFCVDNMEIDTNG